MFLVDNKLSSLNFDVLVSKEDCASLQSYTEITMKFISERILLHLPELQQLHFVVWLVWQEMYHVM